MQLMRLGEFSLLCFLCLCISSTYSSRACSNYRYKYEPVEDLLCNPYTNNETDVIKLECSVRGPLLPDGISLTIRWVRNLDSKGAIESLDELAEEQPDLVDIRTMSVFTQTPSDVIIDDVRSVLTLHDVIPNDVAGSYYCHAEVTVSDPDGGVTVLASEESTITRIRNEYTTEKVCRTAVHRQSGNLACVSFSVAIPESLRGESVAPPPPSESGTVEPIADLSSSTSSSASVSNMPTSTLPSEDQDVGGVGNSMLGMTSSSPSVTSKLDGAKLSPIMIIILSSVGGGLCIVIHVLLALVGCLWVKSRKKRRGREFRVPDDSRKVSTVSLISSAPTSVISLPPHHALPTLPSPVGTQATTPPGPPGPSGALPGPQGPPSENSSLPPAVNNSATSPSGQRYALALAPPSHPPPIAPKSKLANPQSHLTQHRSTLPTRLTHQVSLEPLPSCRDDHDDLYASVLARHERRAATIAGDMGFYAPASPTHQQLSPILDHHDNSYKSLNEYLMDDQQEYEAPCGVRENYRNLDVSIDNEIEDEDDSDSDLDRMYMQTIARNTGSVSVPSEATPTTIPTTTTPTSTTDKDAGLLKRDIPLPPQCPIPMPPGKTCKLPGFNLMPPPRSPSPMPPGVVIPSGYRGNDEIPPPPSIHLIPSRNANPVPITTTTTTPVLLRANSSETPSPPSVHLIPPYSNTAGQVTPKSIGSEIPPPRILNLNSSSSSSTTSMLRSKTLEPGMHPILAQKLKSLVPVARVSMDGEYVVPNEALEAEGGLLSDGEAEEEEKEEGLADYIDIS